LTAQSLHFVGLQEADAGPVRRSSLAEIVCHVCRAPFVGATATSSVRSEQRAGIEAQRQAVATYSAATGVIAEVESGKRSDRPALDKALAAARVRQVPLVFAKLDRLTRLVAFLTRLLEAGVDVRFADLPMIEGATGKSVAADGGRCELEAQAGSRCGRRRTRLSLAPTGCTLVAPPLALCSSLSEISDGQPERCNRLSVNSQIHLSG